MKSKLDKELEAVGLYISCGFVHPITDKFKSVASWQIINLLKPYQSLITRLTIGLTLSFLLNVWALWGIYEN